MTLPVRILATARRDLLEQEVYFAEVQSNELRDRFRNNAAEAIKKISEFPGIGPEWRSSRSDLRGVRMWSIPQFPKLIIFYRKTDEVLEVIRILHTSRDIPGLLSKDR